MKVLALEPYYGGSHKALLDGWSAHSRHDWTVLGLPAHHWKWRMRHAAVTLAEQARERASAGANWDVVFCSDMLNLAEWAGLAGPELAALPRVAYFHENQLTYPVRHDEPRDVHFGFSNMMTALAADAVWFNSAFHRDAFLAALGELLGKMPDFPSPHLVEVIHNKSVIHPPGAVATPPRPPRPPGPLRILWAARWEHDKNPDEFFEAVRRLAAGGADFRLSVIGEQFRDGPPVFARARKEFAGRIDRWGYQPTRGEYVAALHEADVLVSTARHEFFGIAAVEAAAAGAYPLLPRRLAYPEVFADLAPPEAFFYDGGADVLADRLAELAERAPRGDLWPDDPDAGRRAVAPYTWPALAPRLDEAIERLCRQTGGG